MFTFVSHVRGAYGGGAISGNVGSGVPNAFVENVEALGPLDPDVLGQRSGCATWNFRAQAFIRVKRDGSKGCLLGMLRKASWEFAEGPECKPERPQRRPRSLQNQFWRPPTGPMGEEDVSEGLGDASRPGMRRPLGGPKLVQTCNGSISKTQLNSNRLLERFWGISETDRF